MNDALLALIRNPEGAGKVPRESIPALMAQLAALQSILASRLVGGQSSSNGNAEGDRLVGIQEAAQKLGVSTQWLYRRAAKLHFVVRMGRKLTFSEQGIERYIKQRAGRA